MFFFASFSFVGILYWMNVNTVKVKCVYCLKNT